MKKLSLSIIASCCMGATLFAQDLHYVQFSATPLLVNPAFTGAFDGLARSSVVYRTQWSSQRLPYYAWSVSEDVRIARFRNGDFVAIGLNVDETSVGDGDINNAVHLLSAAYHKKLGKGMELSLGVDGRYVHRSINLSYLFFEPPPLPPPMNMPQPIIVYDAIYYDIDPGVSFSQQVRGNLKYTAGIAANGFMRTYQDKLDSRPSPEEPGRTVSGTLEVGWQFSSRFSLRSSAIWVGNKYNYVLAGGEVVYSPRSDSSHRNAGAVFAGVWYSTGDHIPVTAGFQFRRVRVSSSLSFDRNFRTTGFEMSLQYIQPFRKLVSKPAAGA